MATAAHTVRWLMCGSLIRQFAVLSFVVIAVTTGALSAVISRSLQDDMLAREWHVTADYIRAQALESLSPLDLENPHAPSAQEHFFDFYRQMMRMPEILRVKVYDRSRAVAWSDEPRLIGQRFADNPQLVRALGGETVAHVETTKKAENVFEASERMVELYVPITLSHETGVTAIVETYKTPEEVFANIRRAQRMVVGTALAGGALLWASLFGIVRGAARRIERQHEALERRTGELTAANAELRSVQAQLVDAGRMAAIGEVVAAVAHGIRNPLANIRASAQVALLDCRAGDVPSTPATSLKNVIREVDRLAARIGELLRFVRPAERRAQLVDLHAVLHESLDSLADRRRSTTVDVVEDLAPARALVSGDPALLEQAVTGILENALDAMGDGPGVLTIVTGCQPGPATAPEVFAEIRDTGNGIAPEHLGRIFELFFTTKSQGTGLGLALANKFIEGHGGRLCVRSEPGAGAAFRATFPAAASA